MSEESVKAELWEARVDAVTGTRFFVHRLTKAVRQSSPSQLVPEVLASPRIRFAGAVDAFRKELILIMSSPALSSEAKEKQCRCVLTDTWHLLCSEASGDHAADPIFYVSTLMDVYDAASIAASAMLDSGTILASCLSFLVDSKQGARLFFCAFVRNRTPSHSPAVSHSSDTLLKTAVVNSVRNAALLYTTSTHISLPPSVRKSILLLLSIGPETHEIICNWLIEGCQTALNDSAATSSHSLALPQSNEPPAEHSAAEHLDHRALVRSICEGNRFMAELCKYLSAETQNLETSLRSILHSVISESTALSSLLAFEPSHISQPPRTIALVWRPFSHSVTRISDLSKTTLQKPAYPSCSLPYLLHLKLTMTASCHFYLMRQPPKLKP